MVFRVPYIDFFMTGTVTHQLLFIITLSIQGQQPEFLASALLTTASQPILDSTAAVSNHKSACRIGMQAVISTQKRSRTVCICLADAVVRVYQSSRGTWDYSRR